MATYSDPILSEEQMAAYLDGMLPVEECAMVEGIIAADPELQELQNVIDDVDADYIAHAQDDIPLECLADDFCLPEISLATDVQSLASYDSAYQTSDTDDLYPYRDDADDTDEQQDFDSPSDQMGDTEADFDSSLF